MFNSICVIYLLRYLTAGLRCMAYLREHLFLLLHGRDQERKPSNQSPFLTLHYSSITFGYQRSLEETAAYVLIYIILF